MCVYVYIYDSCKLVNHACVCGVCMLDVCVCVCVCVCVYVIVCEMCEIVFDCVFCVRDVHMCVRGCVHVYMCMWGCLCVWL